METTNSKSMMQEVLQKKLGGRARDISEAIKHISDTGEMLNDFIIPTRKMNFEHSMTDNDAQVTLDWGDEKSTLHNNAVDQLAVRFGITAKDLRKEANGHHWEKEAFINRLNQYSTFSPDKNTLIRQVNGKVISVLSDRYKRINTAGVFMAFLQAAMDVGSVLVDAAHTDLKDFLEVIHPDLLEIDTVRNGKQFVAMGSQIRNSDHGAGKLAVKSYLILPICMNGMTGQELLGSVHLGSKLEGSGQIDFSDETYAADTKARSLAVRDVMKSLYSPANIARERSRVETAADMEIDFVKEIKELPKLGVHQDEIQLLEKTLMESDPNTGVQGGNSLWKMSQALTWTANKATTPERKRDLQDIASNMMNQYLND